MKFIKWFFNRIDFVGRNWGKPRPSLIDNIIATRWYSVVAGVLIALSTLWNGLTGRSSHPVASLCISIGMLMLAATITFAKLYRNKQYKG